jgi:hypothetical protein
MQKEKADCNPLVAIGFFFYRDFQAAKYIKILFNFNQISKIGGRVYGQNIGHFLQQFVGRKRFADVIRHAEQFGFFLFIHESGSR